MTAFSPSSHETTRLPQVGQDGRPLTRRQRRELERAREGVDSQPAAPPAPDWTQPAPRTRAGMPAPAEPLRAEEAEETEAPVSVFAPSESAAPATPSLPSPSATSATSALSAAGPPSTAEPPTSTGAQRAIGAALGRPRPRGRVAVILAVVAAVARVWGGGAGSPGSSGAASGGTVSADGPLDTVLEVAGRVGAVPVVSLKGSLAPATAMTTDQIVAGQGRTLSAGDAVVLSVAVFDGDDGTNVTGTKAGTRLYRGTLDADKIGADLANAVMGVSEGSRLVVRAPRTKDDQTRSTEITVIDVLPTTATGTTQSPAEGTPAVTVNDDGTATLSVQGLPVPTRSTAAVLVQGDGPQVGADSVVLARYATVNWADGNQHATTYGMTTPPGTIDMRNALAGVKEHLVDAQVGSRIVISIPADQAAGEGAVAVVVDVLAIADDRLTDGASATGAAAPPTPDPDNGPGIVHVTPSANQ
mgnify:CR=1 FL=1